MIIPIPYVPTGVGTLSILFALPLVLRSIPMNRFYGIRLQETFLSDRNWYQINTLDEALFLIFGLFLVGFGHWIGEYAS
jgi:hypothetical protein